MPRFDDPTLNSIYELRKALTRLEMELMDREPGDKVLSDLALECYEHGALIFNHVKVKADEHANNVSGGLPLS